MSGDHSQDKQELLKRSAVVGVVLIVLAIVVGMNIGVDEEVFSEDVDQPNIDIASLPGLTPREIDRGLDYSLDQVARTKLAPDVILSSLDFDLRRIKDVNEKKETFFKVMLPIIAAQNDKIRAERQQIIDDPADAPKPLYEKYDVEVGDVDALLKRVDVVPASLVLAKAALESGWGSSRFARKGNNFFGMRTYDEDVPGIAPKGATGFKVIKYRNINHGVRMYMQNINKHSAYAKLRAARAKARDAGKQPSGMALTNYLTAYSEIPEEYGNRLRSLIKVNKLSRFDGVRLDS